MAGVAFKPFLFASRDDGAVVNAGASAVVRVPGLVPLSLTATLFPSAQYAASGGAGAIFFVHEIQKGIPIAVFVHRVYIAGGYSAQLAYDSDTWFDVRRTAHIMRSATRRDYSDSLWIKGVFHNSLNYGFLAGQVPFEVGYLLQYHPNPEKDAKKVEAGITLSLVY